MSFGQLGSLAPVIFETCNSFEWPRKWWNLDFWKKNDGKSSSLLGGMAQKRGEVVWSEGKREEENDEVRVC